VSEPVPTIRQLAEHHKHLSCELTKVASAIAFMVDRTSGVMASPRHSLALRLHRAGVSPEESPYVELPLDRLPDSLFDDLTQQIVRELESAGEHLWQQINDVSARACGLIRAREGGHPSAPAITKLDEDDDLEQILPIPTERKRSS
jgi:hypothetical protein